MRIGTMKKQSQNKPKTNPTCRGVASAASPPRRGEAGSNPISNGRCRKNLYSRLLLFIRCKNGQVEIPPSPTHLARMRVKVMRKICNKRISLILFQTVGIVILLALISHSIYEFVFVNNGVTYYRKAPYMLFIAVGIACLMGLAIWMFSLLLPKRKRQISLLGWVIGNVAGTCVALLLFCLSLRLLWLELSVVGLMPLLSEHYFIFCTGCLFGTAAVLAGILVVSWRSFTRALRIPDWPRNKVGRVKNDKIE